MGARTLLAVGPDKFDGAAAVQALSADHEVALDAAVGVPADPTA